MSQTVDRSIRKVADNMPQMCRDQPKHSFCISKRCDTLAGVEVISQLPGLNFYPRSMCMIRSRQGLLLLTICFVGLLTRSVRADDASDPHLFKFQALDFSINVPADQRWTAEVLGTGVVDVSNRHVAMYGIDGGVGYYFFNNMALLLDVTGYGYNEGHSNGAAIGVALGLRHHMFTINTTQFFLEVAGGAIEASNNIPAGGTHLNNTIQFGGEIAQPIATNTYLTAGLRYYHISNARSEGPDRNPSVNGLQGVVGVMWRF